MTITLTVDELRRLIADEKDRNLVKSPEQDVVFPTKGSTTLQIPDHPRKKLLLEDGRSMTAFFEKLALE
jgi:hypothetical protein